MQRVVAERYTRDDLECGLLRGQTLSAGRMASLGAAVSADPPIAPRGGGGGGGGASVTAGAGSFGFGWLVIDTNVALHQIDLLEHRGCGAVPALDHVVVTQTVVEEVRHNNTTSVPTRLWSRCWARMVMTIMAQLTMPQQRVSSCERRQVVPTTRGRIIIIIIIIMMPMMTIMMVPGASQQHVGAQAAGRAARRPLALDRVPAQRAPRPHRAHAPPR